MTLKPTDMLEIQSAIDAYERKFPRRPAPSAEVALAWRLGKREWAKRQAAQRAVPQGDSDRPRGSGGKPAFMQQESNRLMWALEQFRLRWLSGGSSEDDAPAELLPWVKKVLLVGWWGVVAVLIASVFFFGAIVGGFK
jgi:hypothetical protein